MIKIDKTIKSKFSLPRKGADDHQYDNEKGLTIESHANLPNRINVENIRI